MKLLVTLLVLRLRLSRPSRARGLKLQAKRLRLMLAAVAPLAGAWIETDRVSVHAHVRVVAPLAGAWIETTNLKC